MRQGIETRKNHQQRLDTGFYTRFMRGNGLDIGHMKGRDTVLPSAKGIDKDYPGYDGIHLPFEDESKDYIYSSHCLEHIPSMNVTKVLQEWFRVLKTYGYIIIEVPHQYLYEKRRSLPSIYNRDHKRFYTPSSLLDEIEVSLEPNSYRVRHLRDNDDLFDYSIPPNVHSRGSYGIELVIQKIKKPEWDLA